MRAACSLVVLAMGCGRIGFDPSNDHVGAFRAMRLPPGGTAYTARAGLARRVLVRTDGFGLYELDE